MHKITVTIDLPFFLRLEKPLTIPYEKVCRESQLSELKGRKIHIAFSRSPADDIDKSEIMKDRSTIAIKVNTPKKLSNESIDIFAISNCREIINNVITSYQATTKQVSNVGCICPLGTSDMQLFAEIMVDGHDFRDRWPSHNINTIPLQLDQVKKFKRYLNGREDLPLSDLIFTNARISLEQGQYSLAVLQAATAIELRLTQVIHKKLISRRWPNEAIEPYEKLTLGQKLRIQKKDPRSLKYHYGKVVGFSDLFKKLDSEITPLRNKVVHKGYLASHDETIQAVKLANEFLKMVG